MTPKAKTFDPNKTYSVQEFADSFLHAYRPKRKDKWDFSTRVAEGAMKILKGPARKGSR